MPKFSQIFILFLCFVTLNLFVQTSFAQDLGEINAEELSDKSRNFQKLTTASQVVFELRKNYGVHGSVELTKTLWKILNSYSDQKQANNLWQTAINQVSNKNGVEATFVFHVDAHYNSGQMLNKYTHGMSVDKWYKNRRSLKLNKNNIESFFNVFDELTVYYYLQEVWTLLLLDIVKQEEIEWDKVFHQSINLFVEKSLDEKLKAPDEEIPKAKNQIIQVNTLFFTELKKWQDSEYKNIELADLMELVDKYNSPDKELAHATIRYLLNKKTSHYLTTALSWFPVVEQLYLTKSKYDKEQLIVVKDFIEQNDAWFLSQEQNLMLANVQMPQAIEESIHSLKEFYNEEKKLTDVSVLQFNGYQLLENKLDRYMSSEFRKTIRENLEVCLNISEEYGPLPQQPIDEKQFIGCIDDMVAAATQSQKKLELSGSLTKIDGDEAFERALQLPMWQIVNIVYAHMAKDECLQNKDRLVNPLEWTMGAESLLWIADRWPAYMKLYPRDKELKAVIFEGEKLANNLPCLYKAKQEILDDEFNQIGQNWQSVKSQIKKVISEFNQNNLMDGSDINLLENFDKASNYRVESFKMLACNVQNTCGIHDEVESSRALFGLFPNHLLVADQLKLGKLKICYDNVGWENRRTGSTHLDNDNVANYYGNFSFSIKGFYNEKLVFERKNTDSQEYLYLFGANTDKVLNTYCPLSIVGEKITTSLERGTFGLVPNRLTFLTASRADESKIFNLNWLAGEEWRDKVVSDQAIVVFDDTLKETISEIQQAYQEKATNLQSDIYQAMLNLQIKATKEQKNLTESFARMNRTTGFFVATNYLLQMDKMMASDDLHGMFFGSNRILNKETIRDFYQNQINLNSLISNIDENFETNKNKWNASADTLSNSHIKTILFHLKSLLKDN